MAKKHTHTRMHTRTERGQTGIYYTQTEAEQHNTKRNRRLQPNQHLVISPAFGQQPLHVLGEEDVPEQELVLGETLLGQH